MIKGAIFDLDGTLLDSMHVWQTFGTDYLKTLGIEAGDWVNKTVMRMSLEEGTRFLREEFNLDEGDLIIITGGFPLGESRTTNYLRILEV